MPENKTINFGPNEYPELSGLESGSKIKFVGDATVTMNEDGGGQIVIDSMDIETDNAATKELKNMTKQESSAYKPTAPSDF